MVALAHAFGIGYGHQPALGFANLADLAVDGFFVLSGFLVTRSLVRTGSLRRYAWHRSLRILPGFWVCLVVTAVFAAPVAAALVGREPLSVFTADDDPAWSYVVANSSLVILQYPIADLGLATGDPEPFNGSLWTLRYEALCYGVVAVLGTVSALAHRRWPVLALAAGTWLGVLAESAGVTLVDVPVFDTPALLRFLLLFLLGSAAFRYADRVPVRWTWALASAVLVTASVMTSHDFRTWSALGFAYLLLYAAVRLPLRVDPSWDLSYGLYVYHWPIQVLMLLAGWNALNEWLFAAVSLTLALMAAVLSWILVEGPSLRAKDARWVGGQHHRPTSPRA